MNDAASSTSRGVALSVGSSFLFAGLYYFSTLLKPLDGESVFGWRTLLTLPCMALFMTAVKEWRHVAALCGRIRRAPALVPALLLSSALLGVQQWLFVWAPINGRGLNVSLGYFLLPLTMLLTGRLAYGERLTPLQKLAALAAALGVANTLRQLGGGFAWEALVVALGFPAYFVLRRRLGTAHLGGLWLDMLLMLPLAAWCIQKQGPVAATFAHAPGLPLLLAVLGVFSGAAFMAYFGASRLLTFSLFGLLGYVEPMLMTLVALLLGERIRAEQWLTYIPIWIAVGLLALDGARHLRAGADLSPPP